MTRRRVLALCLLTTCLAMEAAAQETICDPENPACVTEPTSGTVSDDAAETICDPENPSCGQASSIAAPPALVEEPVQAPPGFQTTQFAGAWGTRLDVDAAFELPSEDIVELSSYLDLGLEWEPRSDFRVVLQGELRHWVAGKENPNNTDLLVNAQRVRASYDARLGQAYAVWRHGRVGIAVGNLISRWGSTDLTRPGDVLNPTDRTAFNALEAPQRLPQLTLDLSYSGDSWALQGLIVPFFSPHRVWSFGRDTSLLSSRNPLIDERFPIDAVLDGFIDPSIQDDIQPVLGATRVPEEVPKNVSLGARATTTVFNTDLGLGLWHGWDRTPFVFLDEDVRTLLTTVLTDGQVLQDLDFLQFFVRNRQLQDVAGRVVAKATTGEELFFTEYKRQQMILIDGARYLGPIGVRFDAAFFPQQTYLTESLRAVRRPTFAPSLGFSWERMESEDDLLTVTVEGFLQKPLAADDPLTESLVSADLRGDASDELLLVGDALYGIAGAFLWSVPWVDTRLQLGGLYNASHGDVIATVSVTRTFFEWLILSAGYTLFEGPDPARRLTLGGLYDPNDQFSFGASGVF